MIWFREDTFQYGMIRYDTMRYNSLFKVNILFQLEIRISQIYNDIWYNAATLVSVLINWAAILSSELFTFYPPWKVGVADGVVGHELRKFDFQVTSPHYLVLTHWTTMLHCKLWVSDVSLSSGMKFQLQLPFLILQPEQELWKTDFSVLIKHTIWRYASFTQLTFRGIFCF